MAAGSLTTHIGPMIVRRSTIGSSKCRRVQMVIGLLRKALSKPSAPKGFSRGRGAGGTGRAGTVRVPCRARTSSLRQCHSRESDTVNPPWFRELNPRCRSAKQGRNTPQDIVRRQKAALRSLSAARDRPIEGRLNKEWIMPVAHLPDRAVISIKGEDAVSFLAGLLTCAVDASPTPRYGALLTPQGKIIADFFLYRHQAPDARGDGQDGFLLDVAKLVAEALLKRLSLYKLRAKVALADLSAELGVLAAWEAAPGAGRSPRLPRSPLCADGAAPHRARHHAFRARGRVARRLRRASHRARHAARRTRLRLWGRFSA